VRSLYTRLVVALLAVMLLSTGILYRAYVAMTSPRIMTMISGSQAAQANEAAVTMNQSGLTAAREYLARLDAATQLPHYLVDAQGRDVLTGDDRSALLQGGRETDRRGERVSSLGDRFVFATASQDNRYRLITVAPLPYRLRDFVPYVLIVFAAVAILFWLLVAYIVRPLHQLASAVQHFGRGQFDVRADVGRHDEIGQLARTFNDMADRIERLVTSERRLLQDVSHELRSPLTRLNIGIELLRTSTDREAAAARLQREADRLSDLVATLLEVVRLEGDVGSTALTRVPLAEVVRGSVTDNATQAALRRVHLAIDGDIVEALNGNAELLRRALDNVIGNAVRYAPPNSRVSVSCDTTQMEQIIEVRDVGPGVPEDQIANLGNAFYRIDESRSSATGGVGLGLAIARRAIHLHRGWIEITNAHPGLRVTIRLPRELPNGSRLSQNIVNAYGRRLSML
jgi:two-component system sensor histidine kinase CpxA